MIQCTGKNCTTRERCMRFREDIQGKAHYDGNLEPQDGCKYFIDIRHNEPDDDMAHHPEKENNIFTNQKKG